jgi:hypothetical protein
VLLLRLWLDLLFPAYAAGDGGILYEECALSQGLHRASSGGIMSDALFDDGLPAACDVNSPDGIAFLRSGAGERMMILIDGQVCTCVVAYDTEGGWLDRHVTDEWGNLILTADRESVKIERLEGVVEARWKPFQKVSS